MKEDLEAARGKGPRLGQLTPTVAWKMVTLENGDIMQDEALPHCESSLRKSKGRETFDDVCSPGSRPLPPMTGTGMSVGSRALVS